MVEFRTEEKVGVKDEAVELLVEGLVEKSDLREEASPDGGTLVDKGVKPRREAD